MTLKNLEIPLLAVQTRKGNRGVILYNAPESRYQKPRLPFGGKSSKVHDHLRQIKVAQALMLAHLSPLQEELKQTYEDLGLVYLPEKICFGDAPLETGRKWMALGADFPAIVAGIVAYKDRKRLDYFSFDGTPFDSTLEAEFLYLKDVDFMRPLNLAIDFYNSAVVDLFDLGILLFPASFMLAKAESYPHLPLDVEIQDF